MSINHLPEEALATALTAGWNEMSVIIHLKGFVTENDLSEDLAEYARAAAGEEGVTVDETATFEDVVDEALWDEDSQIIHLVAIVNNKGLEAELAEYFEIVAEEESDDEDENEDFGEI